MPNQERATITFDNRDLYNKVCGINDYRLKEIEKSLGIHIIPRGNSLLLSGEKKEINTAVSFFHNLEQNFKERPDKENFDTFEMDYFLKEEKEKQSKNEKGKNNLGKQEEVHEENSWKPKDKILTSFKGKPIFPKTRNQEGYVNSLKENLITFALGPAGTGKTFLSIAAACRLMQEGEVEKLVLTRPAVEAGESLGFLPGDLTQKVDPYLRPIYDSLHDCIGLEKTTEYIALNKIEIAPIAFMRGRTLSNSFIILDEAQNCTMAQLKMFLTRFGRNSKMCISGDLTQIDLDHGRSGLERVVSLFTDTPGMGVQIFGREDITRHPIVEMIVRKFEEI